MKYYNFRNQEGQKLLKYEEETVKQLTTALRKCAFTAPRIIKARANYRRAFYKAISEAKEKPTFQGLFTDVIFPDWKRFLQ